MPSYRLAPDAFEDLVDIADIGIARFGQLQSAKYHASLERTFDILAGFPRIGSPSYDLREGLYRFPHKAHVIFYTHAPEHILIVRVLPARADFRRFFRSPYTTAVMPPST